MVTIPPYAFTDVLEDGEIEFNRENGQIELLFDLQSLFVIPEFPEPTVSIEPNHLVAIRSGGDVVAMVQAETIDDAEVIRWTLRSKLQICNTAHEITFSAAQTVTVENAATTLAYEGSIDLAGR